MPRHGMHGVAEERVDFVSALPQRRNVNRESTQGMVKPLVQAFFR